MECYGSYQEDEHEMRVARRRLRVMLDAYEA
jgi:CHAD domain-containing protein